MDFVGKFRFKFMDFDYISIYIAFLLPRDRAS